MDLSTKERKVIAGLTDAVNTFISENSEKIGLGHVESIVLTKDCKKAKVYINFLSDGDVKYFEKNKKKITEIFNKKYSTKTYPSLTFYSFNDEFNI